MPLTRVYLPARLAANFQQISEAEEALRAVRAADAGGVVPIMIVPPARAPRGRTHSIRAPSAFTREASRLFPYSHSATTKYSARPSPKSGRRYAA